MSIKSWVLHRVHGAGALAGRPDLAPRAAAPDAEPGRRGDASFAAEPAPADAEQLGAYAPLIGALRDELEHFVASHVRLHVVIADRDRFMLTALGVRSPGGDAARELLQQFLREFRPEQVKRYIGREVIGRLPNAAVIDLSQFAGLTDLEARRSEAESEYAELIAALRIEPPTSVQRPYEIAVMGRWSEPDPDVAPGRRAETPTTPLAGRRCELDVTDAEGRRCAVINGVVAGRRYVIGKSEECEIRVDGKYTSRRHAELWLEHGRWHVADAGSTNGIRVERLPGGAPPSDGVEVRRAGAGAGAGDGAGAERSGADRDRAAADRTAIALDEGWRIVLSARAEGPPGDYPQLSLRPAVRTAVPATPIAAALDARVDAPPVAAAAVTGAASDAAHTASGAASASAAPSAARRAATPDVPSTVPGIARLAVPPTPSTAVLAARAAEPAFEIVESRADGRRVHALRPSDLPMTIGRSRTQTLIIDWSHRGVSGRHVDIDALDETGARGVVHGANGVEIDGRHHAAGERFEWPVGRTLQLGGALPGEPSCALVLVAAGER